MLPGAELGVVIHRRHSHLLRAGLLTRFLLGLHTFPHSSLPWAPASTSSMNSAERVGLKSICFGSPDFHGTPSCIYRGQTPLLGRGRELLLSSPHEPHASSEYLAFCKASMSSVPSFLLNGNRPLPGHLSASGVQSRSMAPPQPGRLVLATMATMALIQHLPFLHPEKNLPFIHSHTTSRPSNPTYLLNSCRFMKNPLSCRINEIL